MSIRLHRALQGITGSRHTRRPCFDIGRLTRDFKFSRLLNDGRLHDVSYSVNKRLIRGFISGDIPVFLENTALNKTTEKNTVVMALNKLSIDKVDLTDKRVLIRYVFEQKFRSRKKIM